MKKVAPIVSLSIIAGIVALALCACSGNVASQQDAEQTDSSTQIESDVWNCVQVMKCSDGETAWVEEYTELDDNNKPATRYECGEPDDGDEAELWYATKLSYDDAGRLVSEVTYDSDDDEDDAGDDESDESDDSNSDKSDDEEVYEETTYSYDDTGQLVMQETSDEYEAQRTYRSYDSNGVLVKETTYYVDDDGEDDELDCEREFNSEGQETRYSSDSSLSETTAEYDKQGRLTSYITAAATTTFKYVDDGRTQKAYEDGDPLYEGTLDKRGNLTSGYVFENDALLFYELREYDEAGHLVHVKREANEYYYEYDDHDLLLAEWDVGSTGSVTVTTYDYVNEGSGERVSGGDAQERCDEHSWTEEKASQKKLAGRSRSLSLDAGKTYSRYDVTGDGEPDKLKMKRVHDEENTESDYDWCKRLDVYVNGSVAYSLTDAYYERCVDARLMVLKDGTPLLYIHTSSDNDDGPDVILKWDGSAFVEALDCDIYSDWLSGNHSYVENVVVSGDEVVIKHNVMSMGVGGIYFFYAYRLSGNELVRTSVTSANVKLWEAKIVTAKKKGVQLYSDVECFSEAFKLAKGKRATIEEAYLTEGCCSLKLTTSSGKSGWMQIDSDDSQRYGPFKECWYAG